MLNQLLGTCFFPDLRFIKLSVQADMELHCAGVCPVYWKAECGKIFSIMFYKIRVVWLKWQKNLTDLWIQT